MIIEEGLVYMKKLLTMLLATLLLCTLFAIAVSASKNENGQTLFSDEIGDYYSYEDGAVKAYVHLNQDAVYARFEGIWLCISDLDGNELILSYWFDFSEHPWLEEIIDEYYRLNSTEDSTPPMGMPECWNDGPIQEEMPVDEAFESDDISYAVDIIGEEPSTPHTPTASSAVSSNPSTGLFLTVAPMTAALVLAAALKRR